MVELQVSSKVYNCTLRLERRITYIRGDSGTGKTGLVDIIDDFNNGGDADIDLKCPRNVVIMTSAPTLDVFTGYKGTVIIIDDRLLTETSNFGNKIAEVVLKNDIYLVIINRVDLMYDENAESSSKSGLDYSVKSILICRAEGINHYFEPLAETALVSRNFLEVDFDCIISEDSYGINDLASVFNVVVKSSQGKNFVVDTVVRQINMGFKKILVFADSANFGRNFDSLIKYSKNHDVYYDIDYECFEYLLLKSNMLKDAFIFNCEVANSFLSWERYFEDYLTKLTKGKLYSYLHGHTLRTCYYRDCDEVCHKEKSKKCDKYELLQGDKINALFEGTDFEYLTKINKEKENGKGKEY